MRGLPAGLDAARLDALARAGINRLEIDCSDVLAAPELGALCQDARAAGIGRIALRLSAGSPLTELRTLEAAIGAGPEHIMLAAASTARRRAVLRLLEAGYVGLDLEHFVHASDPLAQAQEQGRLFRDLDGYSSSALPLWLGIGPGALGCVGPAYTRNASDWGDYRARLDAGHTSVAAGAVLGFDGLLRRSLVHMMLCNGNLSLSALEQAFPIRARSYLAAELAALAPFAQAGAIVLGEQEWQASARGRPILPAMCALFLPRAA